MVTGLGEVASVRRLSMVVWSTGCREIEENILLFRGSTSVRPSSTGSGCGDEEGAYGLPEREDETCAVLSWSCGTAGAEAVEAESSWTLLVESE